MDDWNVDNTLIQGSPAWRGARARRLGGSEIGIVMRVSPYKTRRELWEEKTGRRQAADISRLPHVLRGTRAEPVARRKVELALGVTYTTPVLVHPEHEWAVASLDGICSDHTIEIKTMSEKSHRLVKYGTIPEAYRMQVEWGLLVSGCARGLFVSYRPEDDTLYMVWIAHPSEERERVLMTAAKEFMFLVWNDMPPPDERRVDIGKGCQ